MVSGRRNLKLQLKLNLLELLGSRQSEQAKEAFKNAVSFFPEDVRAWINLVALHSNFLV